MATIASLAVKLSANPAGAVAGLNAFKGAIQKTAATAPHLDSVASYARSAASGVVDALQSPLKSLESLTKAIPMVGEAFALLPAAGSAAFGFLMSSFKAGSENILNMRSAAVRLNTTIEDIQPIMMLAGDSAETASKGLFHMQRTIAEAASGSEAAQKKLEHLGLSVKDLAGKSTGQQFGIIADKLNATGSGGTKAAYGMDIFSKSASEMMKIINRGSAGLAQFRELMESRGLDVTSGQAAMVKQATIAMKQMDMAITALKNNLAIVLAPIITEVSASLGKFTLSARDMQDEMLDAAHAIGRIGAAIKTVFTSKNWSKDMAEFERGFQRIRDRIEEARKTGNKPPEHTNFLQIFGEKAEELQKKLNDMTAAYGRTSNLVEFNRLLREQATALAMMPTGDQALSRPNYHGPEIDLRKEAAARQAAIDAAKKQSDAVLESVKAKMLELEVLDKLTAETPTALNLYDANRIKLESLQDAFRQGAISAEGFAGATLKINEAFRKAEDAKITEIFRNTATPIETMFDKIAELNVMLQQGSLDWITYSRAVGGATKSILDLNHAEHLRMTGAAGFGSQEAFKIINQNTLAGKEQRQGWEALKEAIKRQTDIQQRQQRDLDEIAAKARDGFLAMGRI